MALEILDNKPGWGEPRVHIGEIYESAGDPFLDDAVFKIVDVYPCKHCRIRLDGELECEECGSERHMVRNKTIPPYRVQYVYSDNLERGGWEDRTYSRCIEAFYRDSEPAVLIGEDT